MSQIRLSDLFDNKPLGYESTQHSFLYTRNTNRNTSCLNVEVDLSCRKQVLFYIIRAKISPLPLITKSKSPPPTPRPIHPSPDIAKCNCFSWKQPFYYINWKMNFTNPSNISALHRNCHFLLGEAGKFGQQLAQKNKTSPLCTWTKSTPV